IPSFGPNLHCIEERCVTADSYPARPDRSRHSRSELRHRKSCTERERTKRGCSMKVHHNAERGGRRTEKHLRTAVNPFGWHFAFAAEMAGCVWRSSDDPAARVLPTK